MNSSGFDSIVVDTSIFISNGLRLERGLLGKLSQFQRSPVDLILPDVIRSELQKHLESKTKEVKLKLERALNDASDHLASEGNASDEHSVAVADIPAFVEGRIRDFCNRIGAVPFECGVHVSVTEVLSRYFLSEAPFAETGSKKAEFPDAIVLMAIHNWAEKENRDVLLVSNDKGWENYCASASRLTCVADLSEALVLFNETNAVYEFVARLESELDAGRAVSFTRQVEEGLSRALDGITPEQEADSYLYWEPDGCSATFQNFALVENKFSIIDQYEDWVALSTVATIGIEAEGDFSLSVHDSIDGDYVPMGGVTASAEAVFESEILITVSGDIFGSIDQLEVIDVEVLDPITSVDFGTIEPDFGNDYHD
ncbi:MAG TPA: hypothetical protein ENI17_11170 [Pseudomonas xinjiangensis]|uniref:DUF4935 domain-containing protein n=2 Tax=root TaxID=1 RepID=A0A7V1FRA6_9GAMM|nr:hypothetical protein [Halopseudomonas xinjiangensis]HEC48172.1 hypothetical protein [Halopseudomonas xinjiangensis]